MSLKAPDLAAITTGNLVFGIRDDGRTDLLLVYEADDIHFLARNIPNEATYRFGRDGVGQRTGDGRRCIIVSTAALPPEQYDVAIALDRRIASKPEYPDTRLTEDEIVLLRTHEKFFKAHLLPGAAPIVEHSERLRAVGNTLLTDWDRTDAREDPPMLNEYEDHVPALLSLLEQGGSTAEIATRLSKAATARERPQRVHERIESAAASLIRLAKSWD